MSSIVVRYVVDATKYNYILLESQELSPFNDLTAPEPRHTSLTPRQKVLGRRAYLRSGTAVVGIRAGARVYPCWPGVEYAACAKDQLCVPHVLGWHNDRPIVLGYQTGGETSSGALPADPRQRWRVFFVDEADDVAADTAAPWGTADNYHPAHPFPAVNEVVASVSGGPGST